MLSVGPRSGLRLRKPIVLEAQLASAGYAGETRSCGVPKHVKRCLRFVVELLMKGQNVESWVQQEMGPSMLAPVTGMGLGRINWKSMRGSDLSLWLWLCGNRAS
jgi:hypothetical protein